MEQSVVLGAIEKITTQQTGIEGTAPFMVGEQLKDICRKDAHAAELILQDLDIEAMSLTNAEKKIKAYADGHRKGGWACVTPDAAEKILREFYGLPAVYAAAAEREQEVPAATGKIVNLADFLV